MTQLSTPVESGYLTVENSSILQNLYTFLGKGEYIYGAGDGKIYQFEKNTGELGWELDLGSGDNANTIETEGTSFLYVYDDDNVLYKIDASLGEVVWEYLVNGASSSGYSLAMDSDNFYISNSRDELAVVDRASRTVDWTFESIQYRFKRLTLDYTGNLYGYDGGDLLSLDISTQSYNWTKTIGQTVSYALIVDDNYIYAGKEKVKKYTKSGSLQWTFDDNGSWASYTKVVNFMFDDSGYLYIENDYFGSNFYKIDKSTIEVDWNGSFGNHKACIDEDGQLYLSDGSYLQKRSSDSGYIDWNITIPTSSMSAIGLGTVNNITPRKFRSW
jgi:hypothetical protein